MTNVDEPVIALTKREARLAAAWYSLYAADGGFLDHPDDIALAARLNEAAR